MWQRPVQRNPDGAFVFFAGVVDQALTFIMMLSADREHAVGVWRLWAWPEA